VFVAAMSFKVAMDRISAEAERELRFAVRSKFTLTNILPEGHRRKIEALDPSGERIRAVCGVRWYGGRVPNAPDTVTSLAADVDTFPVVYSDVGLSAEAIEVWKRDRRAAVIGRGLSEKYGWKVGDRIELESTVPPYARLEFIIAGSMSAQVRSQIMYLRRDYLEDTLRSLGFDRPGCNAFWTKAASVTAMRSLQSDVDQFFSATPDPTKSEDENAFFANFTQAFGNIPGLMQTMAVVVVVIIVLVAGNTMMMSFRERTRELAVFKAMGFQSGRIFRIVLAESVLLALLGALLGIAPMAAALSLPQLRGLNLGAVTIPAPSPVAVGVSFGIALLVGFAAGMWPAIQALKLRTTDALRRLA
jgi:putative ABC transport system permease protein